MQDQDIAELWVSWASAGLPLPLLGFCSRKASRNKPNSGYSCPLMNRNSCANKQVSVDVLDCPDSVLPFLETVRTEADANTSALGFFPASVYEEFARRGELYVARVRGEYGGHLLFDASFPRARILQMHCKSELRRRGVARTLLAAAVQRFTRENYLSIQARVAADLVDANVFWEANGFLVQRVERGRGQALRQIRVRIRELDTPQLFPPSGLASLGNPLGLLPTNTTELPLYVIDLNVLFDLTRNRVRHEQVKDLFRAFNAGYCRLGVSEEVREELKRSVRAGGTDPMLELIDTLAQFASPPKSRCAELCDQLAPIVFPNQLRDGILSTNDRSDLIHLATAIHHRVSGFLTSENAHIQAAPLIQARFGLRVLSPSAFEASQGEYEASRTIESTADVPLSLRSMSSADDESIRVLLGRLGVSPPALAGHWLPPSAGTLAPQRLGAFFGTKLVGYLTWVRILGESRILVRAALDERPPRAADAARLLLRSLIEAIASTEPSHLYLEIPHRQPELRDQALSYGFHASGNPNGLSKICVGRLVTPSNWADVTSAIARVGGLRLPMAPPSYSEDLLVLLDCPDGERRHVPLDVLETSLTPAIFALAGRPAVITPIERRFAEPLLGTSPQDSLLPEGSAQLHAVRHFVHDPKAIRKLRRGTLMLFYESATRKGSQEITAVARVVGSHLKRRDALNVEALNRSVLTPEALNKLGRAEIKTVTTIDNIFRLPHPVPLARLKAMGCGKGNDLITARPITARQLQSILLEGFRHA